jgi:nicotinamide mononucleotide transporter
LQALNTLTLAGQSISALEVAAFVTGLLSVWLAQRMHIANWPAGIASVLCFAFVFFGARLYAGALLQLAFVALASYGWWRWAKAAPGSQGLPVTRASWREIVLGLLLGAAGTMAGATLLAARTDSPAPWPDAAVLVFSLLAMWAQAHRRVECWLVWIGVDLIAIPLYWSRSLPLTAALYLLFLLLCIQGWLGWRRRCRAAAG